MSCSITFWPLTPLPLMLVSHDAKNFEMTPLHSLDQNDWNQVQHDIFGHVIPLVQVSTICTANNIVNGIIAFLGSRLSKWGAILVYGHVIWWCSLHAYPTLLYIQLKMSTCNFILYAMNIHVPTRNMTLKCYRCPTFAN